MEFPDSWLSSVLAVFVQQLGQTTAADITMMLRALAGLPDRQRQQLLETVEQQQGQAAVPVELSSADRYNSSFGVQVDSGATSSSTSGSTGSGDVQQKKKQSAGCCYCEALTERAEQLLGYMTAVELCQTLYAVAQLGAAINPLVWSQAVNYTLPQQMHLLAPGDLCLLLYGLAKLQHAVQLKRPLHKRLLLHSHRLLVAGRFKPRDLTAFVWNYSRVIQGCSAGLQHSGLPKVWVSAFSAAASMQLHSFTGRQLGVMLKGLLLLGVVVDQQFVETVSSVLEWQSAKFSKYELAKVSSLLLQLQQVELMAAGMCLELMSEEDVVDDVPAVTAAVVQDTAMPDAVRPLFTTSVTVAAEHVDQCAEDDGMQESTMANIVTARVVAGASSSSSVASQPLSRWKAAVVVRVGSSL